MMLWLDLLNDFFSDREIPMWVSVMAVLVLVGFIAYAIWQDVKQKRKRRK